MSGKFSYSKTLLRHRQHRSWAIRLLFTITSFGVITPFPPWNFEHMARQHYSQWLIRAINKADEPKYWHVRLIFTSALSMDSSEKQKLTLVLCTIFYLAQITSGQAWFPVRHVHITGDIRCRYWTCVLHASLMFVVLNCDTSLTININIWIFLRHRGPGLSWWRNGCAVVRDLHISLHHWRIFYYWVR